MYIDAAAEHSRDEAMPRCSESDSGSVIDSIDGSPSVSSEQFASEWEMDWATAGATVRRALHALGQLCCISNLRVQHMISPQLLFLAVEVLPAGSVAGGPDDGSYTPCSETSLPWTPHVATEGKERGTFKLRGAVRSRERSTSAAIIEALGRAALVKAGAGDVVATDSLVRHSQESLELFAGHLQRLHSSETFTRLSSALKVLSQGIVEEHKPFPTATSSWLAAEPDVLLASEDSSAQTTTSSRSDSAPTGPPLLLVPCLVYLLVDSVRSVPLASGGVATAWSRRPEPLPVRVRRTAEQVLRVVAIRSSAALQDSFRAAITRLVLNISPDGATVAAAARQREAARVCFVNAYQAAKGPSSAEEKAGTDGESSSSSSGERINPALVAAAETILAGSATVLFASAPWFTPCVPTDSLFDNSQLRLLPVFLKALMCSRRGAPVPYFTELVEQLGQLCLRVPCGQLRSCEDPLRRDAAGSYVGADSQNVDALTPGDEVFTPDESLRPATRSPLATNTTLQRVSVLCAQAVGVAFNKMACSSAADTATFSDSLERLFRFLERFAGIRVVAAAAVPVSSGSVGCSDALSGCSTPHSITASQVAPSLLNSSLASSPSAHVPLPAAVHPPPATALAVSALQPIRMPRENLSSSGSSSSYRFKSVRQLQLFRQRGVLLLVWLCKGLAQRGHPAADTCLRALVVIVTGGKLKWDDTAPVTPDLVGLAGCGLGTIVKDCAPRHPFSRDAGAVVNGIYKQKLFHLIYSVYDTLHGATSVASSDDEDSSSRDSFSRYSEGSTAATERHVGLMTPIGAAHIRRIVPLLLSLCLVATHLPTPIITSDVDQVVPVVLRALDLVTRRYVQRVDHAASSLLPEPVLSFDHAESSRQVAAQFSQLRDACVLSVLPCLRTLIVRSGPVVASHVHTLVPLLLSLAQHRSGGPANKPLVRATAIECLHSFTALQYHKLHPVRAAVLAGLRASLDDPKRAVRRRAVVCRNDWMTMSSGAK
jgi:hypothetical protein